MQYKGVHKSLREIARELGVDAVVEGTVLRAGGRIRITAQPIDAAKETHLWAESYERDMRDILTLQSEVAQAIAGEIRVKLTPQERAHLAQTRPVDPEAYEAYLKGRYHWNRRSGEGLDRAIQFFQQAIEKDPTYAAAYAASPIASPYLVGAVLHHPMTVAAKRRDWHYEPWRGIAGWGKPTLRWPGLPFFTTTILSLLRGNSNAPSN